MYGSSLPSEFQHNVKTFIAGRKPKNFCLAVRVFNFMGSTRQRKYIPRPIKFHYCEKCGVKFRVYNLTQKYCGSVKNHIGCVWTHHLENTALYFKKHPDKVHKYSLKYYYGNYQRIREEKNKRRRLNYSQKRRREYYLKYKI